MDSKSIDDVFLQMFSAPYTEKCVASRKNTAANKNDYFENLGFYVGNFSNICIKFQNGKDTSSFA